MAKKKKRTPRGIRPYMIALVYEAMSPNPDEQRTIWYADTPALYAEARLGVAAPSEIRQNLEWMVQRARVRSCRDTAPYFQEWLRDKGDITVDDLIAAVRKSPKKSGAIITEPALAARPTHSNMGNLVIPVKGRTTGVDKRTLKAWQVEFINYEIRDGKLNPNFTRTCQCGMEGKPTKRRQLWADTPDHEVEKEFLDSLVERDVATLRELTTPVQVACYHQAVASTLVELENNRGRPRTIQRMEGRETTIAFDFIDKWDLVFEAFARRYVSRQTYAEIDDFLFRHDIVSPFFKRLMGQGKVHREVVKYRRHFDRRAQQIIMRIHEKMHSLGYRYAGFAREFVGVGNRYRNYQTVGIVYERKKARENEKSDISFHIVYDDTFFLPFVVEKKMTGTEARSRPQPYQRNPARLAYNGRSWTEIDDRTGRVARIWVHTPSDGTLRAAFGDDAKKVKKAYASYLSKFKPKR